MAVSIIMGEYVHYNRNSKKINNSRTSLRCAGYGASVRAVFVLFAKRRKVVLLIDKAFVLLEGANDDASNL